MVQLTDIVINEQINVGIFDVEQTDFDVIEPMLRRSTRHCGAPTYLRDLLCNLIINHIPIITFGKSALQKYISYQAYSPSHKHFVLNDSTVYGLSFYH